MEKGIGKRIHSVVRRIFNHLYASLKASVAEKRFTNKEFSGRHLKYILLPPPSKSLKAFCGGKKSDVLLIVFPACAPKAKYNYMRTLKKNKCWKLFIKDDFAEDKRGNYLVEKTSEQLVCSLINNIILKHNIHKLIFVGSSKGGYEALNFSFEFPNVTVCAGGPQYYLGSYLKKTGNNATLKDILYGDITEERIAQLDSRLKKKVLSYKYKPNCIYLHYSNKEHTYQEHVKDLITDLRNSGIEVKEDVGNYPNHGDLAMFFPPYLAETVFGLTEI